MTTTKSSFSMDRILPVYRNTLRRYRGSGIFFGALGFLFLPLQYLLTVINSGYTSRGDVLRYEMVGPAQCYNDFSIAFFLALGLIAPLVLATNLFGYMHNKRAVDVYHALPVTRAELFWATLAAGLTLLWVPLAVNFGIVAFVSLGIPGASAGMILLELLCWMVITLSIFAITAFASVQVGTAFDTAAFSLVLAGSLSAIYGTVIMLSSGFLYGYYVDEGPLRVIFKLSPVSLIVERQTFDAAAEWLAWNNVAMLVWSLASLVLLAGAVWLYTRRRSEQAERVGNLGPLQIYVRAVGTLVAGCLVGAMLYEVFDFSGRAWILICIGIGSLISYFIGDVILSRGVRRLGKALPAALATSLAVCLLLSVILFDLTGFTYRVPAAGSVDSIQINQIYNGMRSSGGYWNSTDEIMLNSPEAVELLLAAHQAQVDGYKADNAQAWGGGGGATVRGSLQIEYHLKMGGVIRRNYWGIYPETAEKLSALQTNAEVIRKSELVFQVRPEDIREVELVNAISGLLDRPRLSQEQKSRLIEALRADLLNSGAGDIHDRATALGSVILELDYYGGLTPKTTAAQPELNNNDASYMDYAVEADMATSATQRETFRHEILITPSFTDTIAFLKGLGKSELLAADWSTVTKAYVQYNPYWYQGSILRSSQDDRYDFEGQYDNRNSGGDPPLAELTAGQLADLRDDMFSIGVKSEKLIMKVGLVQVDEATGIEIVTGCFFVEWDALPQDVRDSLVEHAEMYYGSWILEDMGISGSN